MGFHLNVHLPVDAGRVRCPAKRQSVDVETCFSCPRMRTVTRSKTRQMMPAVGANVVVAVGCDAITRSRIFR
jgi:hypothetical protein